jgi:Ca2+:H+ antiporter
MLFAGLGDMRKIIREEGFLGAAIATSLAFLLFGDRLHSSYSDPLYLTLILAWLFSTVLGSVLSVVRHADHVAERLGEPYGTLVLTLSVTAIEAMSISGVMLHGANNPTLVRDTLMGVIMIILNGMVGISLLAGGWRHREQQYNLQGANAYLSVIIPLAVLGLVLPDMTVTTAGPTLSGRQEIFLSLMSICLYCAFLAIQAGRHRGFFVLEAEGPPHHAEGGPLWKHVFFLAAYMVPVVFLAEQLAPPVDYVIETLNAPAALGGLAIAVLVATPEAIGATKAAFHNQLQRSVNIFLGSVLSTIGLTIPAMLLIGRLTGHVIFLGVEHGNLVLLLLTLFLSAITFTSGRTNILQGLVHVLLFFAYIVLIFEA